MKRLIYVSIIIVLIATASIYSSAKIDSVTLVLIEKLQQAYQYNVSGDFEAAKKAVDEFHDIYSKNETLFILFVRRDLVYNVHTTAASLRDYANDETSNDFNADLMKTIEHIEVIRFNMLRLT